MAKTPVSLLLCSPLFVLFTVVVAPGCSDSSSSSPADAGASDVSVVDVGKADSQTSRADADSAPTDVGQASEVGASEVGVSEVGVSEVGVSDGSVDGTAAEPPLWKAVKWSASPIEQKSVLATAACGEGETAVGGSCDCGVDGNITVSKLSPPKAWVCACDRAVAGATARVACGTEVTAAVEVVSQPLSGADQASQVSCPAGHARLGGGISCGDELSNSANTSAPTDNGWSGECDDVGSNPAVYAYCLPTTRLSTTIVKSVFTSNLGTASCGNTAGVLPLTGGCTCPKSWELNAGVPKAGGWICDCNGVSAEEPMTASIVCATLSGSK